MVSTYAVFGIHQHSVMMLFTNRADEWLNQNMSCHCVNSLLQWKKHICAEALKQFFLGHLKELAHLLDVFCYRICITLAFICEMTLSDFLIPWCLINFYTQEKILKFKVTARLQPCKSLYLTLSNWFEPCWILVQLWMLCFIDVYMLEVDDWNIAVLRCTGTN